MSAAKGRIFISGTRFATVQPRTVCLPCPLLVLCQPVSAMNSWTLDSYAGRSVVSMANSEASCVGKGRTLVAEGEPAWFPRSFKAHVNCRWHMRGITC